VTTVAHLNLNLCPNVNLCQCSNEFNENVKIKEFNENVQLKEEFGTPSAIQIQQLLIMFLDAHV
jgi:hypothetical protein